jgi:cobalamin biosynthesis Mg chelatase CobN
MSAMPNTDFVTRWDQREARRLQTRQMVAKLQDLQSQLSTAADGASGANAAITHINSLDDLNNSARETLNALATAQAQLERLQKNRDTEESNYQERTQEIRRNANSRTAAEAEKAAEEATAARQRSSRLRVVIFKLAAVALFVGVLFVIAEY